MCCISTNRKVPICGPDEHEQCYISIESPLSRTFAWLFSHQPESVNNTGNKKQQAKDDIDNQILSDPFFQEHGNRG